MTVAIRGGAGDPNRACSASRRSPVTVVDTGSGAGALQGATAPPVMATVVAVDVPQGPVPDGAIVSIRLPSFDAASVASTATAGEVALVLQAPGS